MLARQEAGVSLIEMVVALCIAVALAIGTMSLLKTSGDSDRAMRARAVAATQQADLLKRLQKEFFSKAQGVAYKLPAASDLQLPRRKKGNYNKIVWSQYRTACERLPSNANLGTNAQKTLATIAACAQCSGGQRPYVVYTDGATGKVRRYPGVSSDGMSQNVIGAGLCFTPQSGQPVGVADLSAVVTFAVLDPSRGVQSNSSKAALTSSNAAGVELLP